MADSIVIDLRTKAQVWNRYRFLNMFPLFYNRYLDQKHRGKSMMIFHIDIEIDTLSGGPTFAQIAAPANIVFNYAAPEQIYIRSSAAGDHAKKIDVIGEKADGSFGQFTLTSDASDGTTPVDCGTWNFIAFAIKNDTWAGNAIIDDDGLSGTVYWTCALGATATTGILIIPTGFEGAFLDLSVDLLDLPSNANAGNVHRFGESIGFILNTYTGNFELPQPPPVHVISEKTRVDLTAMFEGAAVTTETLHTRFLIWEV